MTNASEHDMMWALAPSPLYSCACESCACEMSFPANLIYWCPELGNWYCESCMIGTRGISLEDCQKQAAPEYLSVDIFEEDSLSD